MTPLRRVYLKPNLSAAVVPSQTTGHISLLDKDTYNQC